MISIIIEFIYFNTTLARVESRDKDQEARRLKTSRGTIW
jgi:hypothetical protein